MNNRLFNKNCKIEKKNRKYFVVGASIRCKGINDELRNSRGTSLGKGLVQLLTYFYKVF